MLNPKQGLRVHSFNSSVLSLDGELSISVYYSTGDEYLYVEMCPQYDFLRISDVMRMGVRVK